ncbi:MAG: hypothetical protein R3296_04550 [Oleiphilaceae bacterium]|nr:hypothetical protein [Oleiphilaceae bacterium]
MMTYLGLSGQYSLYALIFGLPVMAGTTSLLLEVMHEEETASLLTMFITFVVSDLVIGFFCLKARWGRIRESTAFFVTIAVMAVAAGITVKPLLDEVFSGPMSEWGKAPVMTPQSARFWKERGIVPVFEKGEIIAAYAVSDASEVRKRIEQDDDLDLEPIRYLEPLMTPLEDLRVEVVDNQFRISGFGSGMDALFVILEGYGDYVSTGELSFEDPERRVFAHEFFDLSDRDRERGYVDLVVKPGTHMNETATDRIVRFRDKQQVHMQYVDNAISN